MEYEILENGKRSINRSYHDTEVASLWVYVQCPYCEHEQKELDMDSCGTTYEIECEDCERVYEMYFDVD